MHSNLKNTTLDLQWHRVRERLDLQWHRVNRGIPQWQKVNQGIPVAEGGMLVSNKSSVKR